MSGRFRGAHAPAVPAFGAPSPKTIATVTLAGEVPSRVREGAPQSEILR